MDKQDPSISMINMFQYPVFCVQNGIITKANQYAQAYQIATGQSIADYLQEHAQDYAEFSGGCLSLDLSISGKLFPVTVMRSGDSDIFHMQPDSDLTQLRAMALVAQQLRQPLSNVLTATDALFPDSAIQDDPAKKELAAQINRGLFQLLRQVGNLSTVGGMGENGVPVMETRDVVALIDELLMGCVPLAEQAGRKITCSIVGEKIGSLVSEDIMVRGVYNLIANAIKFSPDGSEITVKLTRSGKQLHLSVQNEDNGLGQDMGNLFLRYLRSPGIEDGRHGIGLGIQLIRYAASVHHGSLLMDQPEKGQIRFTLSFPIRQSASHSLHAPVMYIDYLGGRDHALVELSDVLPASLFEDIN